MPNRPTHYKPRTQNTSGDSTIKVETLSPELTKELDKAVLNYRQQVKLHEHKPNHAQVRTVFNTCKKVTHDYIEQLKELRISIGSIGLGKWSDGNVRDDDRDYLFDTPPSAFIDEIILQAESQLSAIETKLTQWPKRGGGQRVDYPVNVFLGDVISIYALAGGTPKVPRDTETQDPKTKAYKFDSPFIIFVKSACQLIKYHYGNNGALAKRLRPILSQWRESNKPT